MAKDINVNGAVWREHAGNQPIANTEVECKEMKGDWRHLAINGKSSCDIPTPDAGKVCHDDTECANFCKPDQHSEWYKKSAGTCETHYYVLGCVNGMTNGYPRVGPCFD